MKARTIEGLEADGPLRPNVRLIVVTRLDELRSLAHGALAPGASEAQHEMRIAAKRLRYVLEIFQFCLGEEAAEARRASKQLQSVLGDLHDCALLRTRVEGIDSAAALLDERHERLFHEFVALWQAEASKATWATLEASL